MNELVPDRGQVRYHAPRLAVLVALAALAGTADRFIGPPSDRHAVLFAALVGGVGLATWQLARRWDLAWIAGLATALWSVPTVVPRQQLWIGLAPVLVLLVPADRFETVGDRGIAGVAALVTAGAAFVVGLPAWGIGLAGLLSAAGLLVRPAIPTQRTLRSLETSALFLPAVGLLGLTAVNAGTGWLEQTDALDALGLGIALAGVLVLVGLAIYGLATLLASEDSSQRSAWLTVAMAVGLLVAVVPTREVAALQATAAFAAAPIVALAAIAAARIGRRIDPAEPAYAIPVVATLAQIGLL